MTVTEKFDLHDKLQRWVARSARPGPGRAYRGARDRLSRGAFARLRSVLRLPSTACVAAFAGLLGARVLHLADEDTFLLAATLTLTLVAIALATIPEVHGGGPSPLGPPRARA